MSTDLTKFGYMSGNWPMRCRDCKREFKGDPDAIRCYSCAETQLTLDEIKESDQVEITTTIQYNIEI